MNRQLLAVAALGVPVIKSVAPYLVKRYSDECLEAVHQQAVAFIERACPPGFGNSDLLLLIGATVVALAIWQWDKVASFIQDLSNSRKDT